MTSEKKQLCGDSVHDALRAIGRWPTRYKPVPGDFTEKERFAMFRHVLHEHVWPIAGIIQSEGRIACAWSHSVWSWRHGGRTRFVQRVREAAQTELKEADYAAYDLKPLRCLIGDDGRWFCRLLQAADAAEMEQRMNGMEADLAVIDRKLDAFRRAHEVFGELRYRINLYDSSFEAVIRGGKGGWIWTTLAL